MKDFWRELREVPHQAWIVVVGALSIAAIMIAYAIGLI